MNPMPYTQTQIDQLLAQNQIKQEQYAVMLGRLPGGGIPQPPPVAAASQPQAQAQAAPEVAPPAPRQLTAPPGGAPAAAQAGQAAQAANVPGLDPQIMQQLAAQAGGGAPAQTRPAGLSASDRQALAARDELERRRQEEGTRALDVAQTNADTAAEQSQALSDDVTIAKMRAQQDAQHESDTLGRVRSDAKEASTRLQAQLSDMQAQGIDPNRYWRDQSTAAKLGAAFAVGLGAFGQQLGHGSTNSALEIINGAVNRDLEAQKADMTKNVQVMQLRANKAGQDFDASQALARAERESHQAAWSVALSDFDRRAELVKGNAAAQAQVQALRQGIVARINEGTESKIQNEYQIRKAAERPVVLGGGGGGIGKEVLDRADKLVGEYAAKGQTLSRPQAMRLALEAKTGIPAGPEGFAQQPPMAQGGPGAGKISPRIVKDQASMAAQIAQLEEAKKLTGASLSPDAYRRYEAIRETNKDLPGSSWLQPGEPGGYGAGTKIDQLIKDKKREAYELGRRASGAAAGDEEEPDK